VSQSPLELAVINIAIVVRLSVNAVERFAGGRWRREPRAQLVEEGIQDESKESDKNPPT